ncbi:hypothetical protein GOARA_027_00190 [Gordonia araii NBRC 100433]|uniref:AttH domain-containing protein n=1 Tax=Gordonia araii NBRC 100433 TaxID=1073574 RepID=G7GZN1_9ACTN|nr:DUF6670 family protein [Gordonia araii]NNG98881.1 hypothetical protein [Gordonia araii NBRC 100433]GAB09056.1 hypothetical protein GOARA_027_00190 [Gordonia araii NBRC 100433]
MPRIFSTAVAKTAIDVARPALDSRLKYSRMPYAGNPPMLPYTDSKRWAWTHYGVFIPSLSEPHRFLNVMTLIGTTGTEIFDDGTIASDDVRTNSTLLCSTAHDDQHHYAAYDAHADCEFADDGSRLAWDEQLTITRDGDSVEVHGLFDSFTFELSLNLTDQVSYFTRTPIYQHLSLLAPYTGTIVDADGTSTSLAGLGTFEYARCMGPQSLTAKPVRRPWRLPVDFFTYQIIQLDEVTQLLLTEVTARGSVACRLVHVRNADGTADVLDDVDFTVDEYQREPRIAPNGIAMRVPLRHTWTARRDGEQVLHLTCEVDQTLRYGHGNGYAGSYDYAGQFHGKDVSGIGYLEWVEMRIRD